VAAGKELIIAKGGNPMARLIPVERPVREKRLELLQGKIAVTDEFNTPLSSEVLSPFEN